MPMLSRADRTHALARDVHPLDRRRDGLGIGKSDELTQAGPLKMSGLMIGALRDKSMSPAMQFRDEATVVGYVELYGQLTGQVSARMEVASTLDGPALKTIQPGGQATAEADKFLLLGEIPIADLKPGDYVVRAFVSIQGQPEGRVVRTLRKVE